MFEIEDRARPTIHGEERSVSSNLPFGINEMLFRSEINDDTNQRVTDALNGYQERRREMFNMALQAECEEWKQ